MAYEQQVQAAAERTFSASGAKSTQPTLLTCVAGELSMVHKELVDLLARVELLGNRLFGRMPEVPKTPSADGVHEDCLMDKVRQPIEEIKHTIGNLRVSVARLEEL